MVTTTNIVIAIVSPPIVAMMSAIAIAIAILL